MKLDKFDIGILGCLVRQGRISKKHLAKRVGLSLSPVWGRLRNLEQDGVIRGYGARLDLSKIAPAITVTALVGLRTHTASDFERFEKYIQNTPEVASCEAVIGEFNYIVRFIVRDIQHYQSLMDRLLAEQIGIERCHSHITSRTICDDEALAVSHFLDHHGRMARPAYAIR